MSKKDTKVDALVVQTGVDIVKLTTYRTEGRGLADFLSTAPCSTPAHEAWFSEQLSSVRALSKTLDDERMKIKRPLLDAGKAIDALFRPALEPLKACEDTIRDKLQGAAQARLDASSRALALAATAAETGSNEAVFAALAELPEAAAPLAGSSAGEKWEVESYDVEKMAASAVGRQYLVADTTSLARVCAVAGKQGHPPVVAGVVFRRVATIRAKG